MPSAQSKAHSKDKAKRKSPGRKKAGQKSKRKSVRRKAAKGFAWPKEEDGQAQTGPQNQCKAQNYNWL